MQSKKKIIVQPDSINPVDYYNNHCVQETIEMMLKLKNVKRTGIDSITYITNKSDETKRMVVFKDGFFTATMENGFNMAIGEPYSSFMMLQKFVFKKNFALALSYVVFDKMNNEKPYIRVGTKYYKVIRKKDRYDISRTELKIWDRATLVDDHGREFISTIPKFDDFTIVPDNKEFKSIIDNNYNLYYPFEHEPNEGALKGNMDFHWTETLLKHIFGEQYDLGLIYLKVLYDHPKQALPILVLTSEERSTGKSTFVDYLSNLFGGNTVIINPQDIASGFNGSYADKNIIMIEESRFESTQATEKLKNLSTQKKILVNSKFVQQYSIPFYGKLIITSNDENKFSKVDSPEIRYWVRKVPSLKGKANHRILEHLTDEIPAFLHYLNSLPDVDIVSKSRMVFDELEIKTDALTKVKIESRVELHKELLIYLDNHCMQNSEIEEFNFVALDIKNKFFKNNHSLKTAYINKVLKHHIKLDKSEKTKRYIPLQQSSDTVPDTIVGKPYIYKNKFYNMKFNEIDKLDGEINDLPF